jgi:hypothetical protein
VQGRARRRYQRRGLPRLRRDAVAGRGREGVGRVAEQGVAEVAGVRADLAGLYQQRVIDDELWAMIVYGQ